MFWYIYLIIHIVTCFPFFFWHPYFHAYMYTWRYNCWSWALLWANQSVSTAFGRSIMELWTRYVSFQPWHLLVAGASHGHYNTCKYENHVNEALWLYLWLYSFSDQDRIVLLFPVSGSLRKWKSKPQRRGGCSGVTAKRNGAHGLVPWHANGGKGLLGCVSQFAT